MLPHLRSMLGRMQSLAKIFRTGRPWMVFFGIITTLGLVFLIEPAWAAEEAGWLINGAASIMLIIANIALGLTIFFLRFFIMIASYNNYIDVDVVQLGWIMVRDVANMFFVVALLVIAFGTILGLEEYEWKKNLVKLILAAILINFSNLIAQLVIDVAHVFSITFLNAISATAGGNLITMFKLESITSLSAPSDGGSVELNLFAAALTGMIFAVMAACAMGSYLVVMMARVVALWALIILSPLAFVLGVLPKTKSYAEKWWSEFSKYVIVAPVMVFFLWLSFATLGLGNVAKQIENGLDSNVKITDSQGKYGLPDSASVSWAKISSWENMANFFVAFAFLMYGIKATQETGVVGSGAVGSAVDFGKKVISYASGYSAAKYIGGKTLEGAKWVGKEVGTFAAKRAGVYDVPENIANWYKAKSASWDKYAFEGPLAGWVDKQKVGAQTEVGANYQLTDEDKANKLALTTRQVKDEKTGEITTKHYIGKAVDKDYKVTAEEAAKGYRLDKDRDADGNETFFVGRKDFLKDENGDLKYKSGYQKWINRRKQKLIAGRKALEKTEKEGKLNEELLDKRTEGLAVNTYFENWGLKDSGWAEKDYDRVKSGMLEIEEERSAAKTREFKNEGAGIVLAAKRLKGEGGKEIEFQEKADSVAGQIAAHKTRGDYHEERRKEIMSRAMAGFKGKSSNQNWLTGKIRAELEVKAQDGLAGKAESEAMLAVAGPTEKILEELAGQLKERDEKLQQEINDQEEKDLADILSPEEKAAHDEKVQAENERTETLRRAVETNSIDQLPDEMRAEAKEMKDQIEAQQKKVMTHAADEIQKMGTPEALAAKKAKQTDDLMTASDKDVIKLLEAQIEETFREKRATELQELEDERAVDLDGINKDAANDTDEKKKKAREKLKIEFDEKIVALKKDFVASDFSAYDQLKKDHVAVKDEIAVRPGLSAEKRKEEIAKAERNYQATVARLAVEPGAGETALIANTDENAVFFNDAGESREKAKAAAAKIQALDLEGMKRKINTDAATQVGVETKQVYEKKEKMRDAKIAEMASSIRDAKIKKTIDDDTHEREDILNTFFHDTKDPVARRIAAEKFSHTAHEKVATIDKGVEDMYFGSHHGRDELRDEAEIKSKTGVYSARTKEREAVAAEWFDTTGKGKDLTRQLDLAQQGAKAAEEFIKKMKSDALGKSFTDAAEKMAKIIKEKSSDRAVMEKALIRASKSNAFIRSLRGSIEQKESAKDQVTQETLAAENAKAGFYEIMKFGKATPSTAHDAAVAEAGKDLKSLEAADGASLAARWMAKILRERDELEKKSEETGVKETISDGQRARLFAATAHINNEAWMDDAIAEISALFNDLRNNRIDSASDEGKDIQKMYDIFVKDFKLIEETSKVEDDGTVSYGYKSKSNPENSAALQGLVTMGGNSKFVKAHNQIGAIKDEVNKGDFKAENLQAKLVELKNSGKIDLSDVQIKAIVDSKSIGAGSSYESVVKALTDSNVNALKDYGIKSFEQFDTALEKVQDIMQEASAVFKRAALTAGHIQNGGHQAYDARWGGAGKYRLMTQAEAAGIMKAEGVKKSGLEGSQYHSFGDVDNERSRLTKINANMFRVLTGQLIDASKVSSVKMRTLDQLLGYASGAEAISDDEGRFQLGGKFENIADLFQMDASDQASVRQRFMKDMIMPMIEGNATAFQLMLSKKAGVNNNIDANAGLVNASIDLGDGMKITGRTFSQFVQSMMDKAGDLGLDESALRRLQSVKRAYQAKESRLKTKVSDDDEASS